jgi:hypothetical protein
MHTSVAVAEAQHKAAVGDADGREAELSRLQDHERGVPDDRVDQLLLRGPKILAKRAHFLLLLGAVTPQPEERAERFRFRCGADGRKETTLFRILKIG